MTCSITARASAWVPARSGCWIHSYMTENEPDLRIISLNDIVEQVTRKQWNSPTRPELLPEICGVNTAQLPVLKSAETRALLEQARAGDKAAREKLISGNLRLVLSVVQKFAGRGESMDDLFQVGCIGLIKAIDCFDLSQNVQFSTYGVPMIAGELRRFLRDHSAVRVSRSMRDTAYKVLQAKEKLTAETGREPDVETVAAALQIPRQEVVFALEAICDPVSLYEPVYSDAGESATVMDQIGDKRNTDEHWLEQIALADAVKRLTPREKRILALRFYDGRTQMEVAKAVGISQAQVSRLEKTAIQQIKKNITARAALCLTSIQRSASRREVGVKGGTAAQWTIRKFPAWQASAWAGKIRANSQTHECEFAEGLFQPGGPKGRPRLNTSQKRPSKGSQNA